MGIHETFVSAKEAAQILEITSARIGFLCRQGRFKGAEKIGSGWVIPRDAVLNHVRLKRGVKPRGYNEKKLLEQAIQEATNLNKEDSHDYQGEN